MRQAVKRGTGSRQQPHCPAPRRGSSWRMVATVMTSSRSVVGTSPATRCWKRALGRRKSGLSAVDTRMRLGGGCEEQTLWWNGRGYINPTKGGRGGDSEGTILRI